jgi:hypothetical protein
MCVLGGYRLSIDVRHDDIGDDGCDGMKVGGGDEQLPSDDVQYHFLFSKNGKAIIALKCY